MACLKLVGLSSIAAAIGYEDVKKKVLNTEWWPPGTENTTESIGIVSHGLVFMTAMMELDDSILSSMKLEVSDVNDIAKAGNVTLEDLVDCYLHARPGTGSAVRKAFIEALPANAKPAITVIETLGEYDWANNSASCIAAQPSKVGLHDGLSFGANGTVAAGGLLFIPGISIDTEGGIEAELSASLTEAERVAGGSEMLLDCIVFVRNPVDLGKARALIEKRFPESTGPATSIVQVGLEDHALAVTLKCVAALGSTQVSRTRQTTATPRYVFASGQVGNITNGTDAMLAVGEVLKPSGATLSDVVNCVFFVRKLEYMNDFFGGFYATFNVAHFPPPSRGEFVGSLECTNCTILAKCIAALPPSDTVVVV